MRHFKEYLIEKGFINTEELINQLQLYSDFLTEKNKVMNLTALKEQDFFEKHFYDSLLLGELYNFANESLLDIGSGAGFPGLVLAIAYPNLQVTLLEPTKKRANFLIETVNMLRLKNVIVISERAEDYINNKRETFDIITARAVAPLRILLELSAPFAKVNGHLLLMKSQNALQELLESKTALSALNLVLVAQKEHVLKSDKSVRINFKITKTKATNTRYPRNFGQIKKNPL